MSFELLDIGAHYGQSGYSKLQEYPQYQYMNKLTGIEARVESAYEFSAPYGVKI